MKWMKFYAKLVEEKALAETKMNEMNKMQLKTKMRKQWTKCSWKRKGENNERNAVENEKEKTMNEM